MSLPSVTKVKDGVNNVEKLEDNLLDNVYEAVLKQTYYMYRLFHGSFSSTKDIKLFKTKLEVFYNIVSLAKKQSI